METLRSRLETSEISFDKETHTYTDLTSGKELISVTRLLSQFKNEFKKEEMALYCARKRMRETGTLTTVADIIKEWDLKAKEACNWGTSVHKFLEEKLNAIINGVQKNISEHSYYNAHSEHLKIWLEQFWSAKQNPDNEILSEQLLYSTKYMIAGTADVILYNHKYKNLIVSDLKTNETIDVLSGYWKNEREKKVFKSTNEYMKEPFQKFSDCNKRDYTLQLSLYAFLLEEMGLEVKKVTLNILHYSWKPNLNFDEWYHTSRIEVPYCKDDIQICLENRKEALCT